MKFINLALATGTLVLAGCSSEPANEVTAGNEIGAETLNETRPAVEAANVSDNEAAPAVPAASEPETQRPKQVPPPREKAEPPAPKEEPVDLHAGHDMNNMSH